MSKHFILLNDHTTKEAGLLEWARWFEKANRRVARTEIDGYIVSTVFLGLDHQFDPNGQPEIFETMIFGPDGNDEGLRRYSTWDEAVAGHEQMVKSVREREIA